MQIKKKREIINVKAIRKITLVPYNNILLIINQKAFIEYQLYAQNLARSPLVQ